MGNKLKYEDLYTDKPVMIADGETGEQKVGLIKKQFDWDKYKKSGRTHHLAELLLVIIFGVYIGWGIYSLSNVYGYLQNLVVGNTEYLDIIANIIKDYYVQALIIIGVIYVGTLSITYLIVKWFSKLASWFIYGSLIVQIIFFSFLVWYVEWEYSYLFLIPAGIQAFILLFWRSKLQRAVQYVKISGMAIWKERGLLVPQFIQTIWIIVFSFFHVVTTLATFLDLNEINSVTIGTLTIEQTGIYIGYSALFVFLVYIILYSTLGIKMLEIHHWYRGDELTYFEGFSMIRRRWRGLMGYSLSSTLIHMIQFVQKVLKGEINPTNLLEAAQVTSDLAPDNPMSLDADEGKTEKVDLKTGKKEKKKIPLHERLWMGLNYFTLPAIVLEDKNFVSSVWRSLTMVVHHIADIYIKQAHVNKLFRIMQWASVSVSGVLGAIAGWLVGTLSSWTELQTYAAIGAGVALFVWIAGFTSVLVLNDLNMAYITIMYIHSIDDKYGKEGYTRFELEKQEEIEKNLMKKETKKKAKLEEQQKKEQQAQAKVEAKKKK
jgi:hypothetical protein